MASTIENKALKEQFETLQKQQQEKLLRRKQKKEGKDRQKSAISTNSVDPAASAAFGVTDDLDLKLADPPPQGSIYSEELVNHLNDQIREMKDESGRLYKLLSERDLELRQLRKKHDKSAATGGVTNETAATKIVELSKKVRELTADLEKEKTKAKQSVKRCFDLENELQLIKENVQMNTTGRKAVPPSAKSLRSEAGDYNDPETKALQEKLKQSEIKNSEYRNQALTLKKDLSMAQKVIEQEVGEGATIQQLLGNSTGWRGRAQQIIQLQKKVNDLKSQMDQNEGVRSGEDLESEMLGTTTATARRKTAERQREQLRKMEKERKEQQERMVAELKALEGDHDTVKSKLEASKARNKVLANEVKSLKQQQQTLLEKGKHDDELIQALFKQQSQLKSAIEDTDKKQKEASHQKEETVRHMTQKDMKERNLIDQLSAIVAEKESKVRVLEQEVEQLKLAHLQKAQLNSINEMFQQSSRPSTAGSTSIYGNQRVQVDTMVVDDYGTLTPTQQDRPSSSHTQPDSFTDRPPSSRPATAVISAPNPLLLQELEELRLQCQEYKSLCQTATVERDKLAELVQVLQSRNQEATSTKFKTSQKLRNQEATTKAADSQSELLSLRRKNVDLEKRLGKATIDKGQSATTKRTRSKVSLQSINFEEDPFGGEANMEEVTTQLEIQRDENEALKAALQSTLQAKEEDLRLYNQMLEETKTIFLQGLRQYRQTHPS